MARKSFNPAVNIHIVSSPPRTTRLTVGKYIADVLFDRHQERACFYVIQRLGSAEVIDMQHFDSFHDAEEAAKKRLEELQSEEIEIERRFA